MDVSLLNDEEAVAGLSLQEEILATIGLDPNHLHTEQMQLVLIESAEERMSGETLDTKLNLLLC